MKFKTGLSLLAMTMLGLAMHPVLAEESQETTQEETAEETTVAPETTEETTVAIPYREDVIQAVLDQGYEVYDYYRPEGSIVVDADTGEIVFGQNIDRVWDPASMSKLMTAYLLFTAIHEGKISLQTMITATEEDRAISTIEDISNNKIVAGVNYPVEDLIYLMLYPSSNVATLMLSRAISESDGSFVDQMNATAQKFGMTNTKFFNASGAVASAFRGYYEPEGYDINQFNETTARDYAILAYHFLKDYPEIINFTKNPLISVMDGTPYQEAFYSYNTSLPGMPQGFFGVDGFKTGSSPSAAFNHIITAKQGDTRFIEVILGVGSWVEGSASAYYRNEIGNGLLKKAFTEYETVVAVPAGVQTIDGVKVQVDKDITTLVAKGKKPTVTLNGDRLEIQTNLPRISDRIEPLTYPVTIVPEETTTQEATTQTRLERPILQREVPDDASGIERFLLELGNNPFLLGVSIIASASVISGAIVGVVHLARRGKRTEAHKKEKR